MTRARTDDRGWMQRGWWDPTYRLTPEAQQAFSVSVTYLMPPYGNRT